MIVDLDLSALLDEAKIMISCGGIHENIVNLQGVCFENLYDGLRKDEVSQLEHIKNHKD